MVSVQSHNLSVAGCAIAYCNHGTPDGPPLVFVTNHLHPLTIYRRQLQAPELQSFRLVSLQLLPDTTAPVVPGPTELAARLRVALHELGLGEALIVAVSYAGNWLLDALPELTGLRGAVLVGTVPVSSIADLAAAMQPGAPTQFLSGTWTATDCQVMTQALLRRNAPPEEQAEVGEALTYTDGRVRTALASAVERGQLADERTYLLQTPTRVLFVLGEEERFWRLEYLLETVAGLPHVAVEVVPGAGHLPFYEQPAAFNARLLALVADTKLEK